MSYDRIASAAERSIAVAVLRRDVVLGTLVGAYLCLPVRGFLYPGDGFRLHGLTFLDQFLHAFRVSIGYFREALEISGLSGCGRSQALRFTRIL
jgi:hypothetical protein